VGCGRRLHRRQAGPPRPPRDVAAQRRRVRRLRARREGPDHTQRQQRGVLSRAQGAGAPWPQGLRDADLGRRHALPHRQHLRPGQGPPQAPAGGVEPRDDLLHRPPALHRGERACGGAGGAEAGQEPERASRLPGARRGPLRRHRGAGEGRLRRAGREAGAGAWRRAIQEGEARRRHQRGGGRLRRRRRRPQGHRVRALLVPQPHVEGLPGAPGGRHGRRGRVLLRAALRCEPKPPSTT